MLMLDAERGRPAGTYMRGDATPDDQGANDPGDGGELVDES